MYQARKGSTACHAGFVRDTRKTRLWCVTPLRIGLMPHAEKEGLDGATADLGSG